MVQIVWGDIAAAKLVVHFVTLLMAGVCAYAIVEYLGRWLLGIVLFPVFYAAGMLAYVGMLRGRFALTNNPVVETLLSSSVGMTAVVLVLLAVSAVARLKGNPKRRAVEIREQIIARSRTDQRTRSVLK